MIEQTIRAAAARGWKLVIVRPGEKKPARPEWQKRFPTLEEALEHARRGGNIGVVTGAASGIVVVDLDTHKKDYRDWPGFDTESKTLRAESARGGAHYYFAAPDEPIKCAGTFAGFTGVDIKGEGGYIILPGSTFEGGTYKWLNDLPLAPFPLELYHATKTPLPARVLPRIIPPVNRMGSYNHDIARGVFCRALCELRDTPIGGRNFKLNHVAYTLGGYVATGLLSRPELDDALLDAALHSGLPQAESEKTIKRSLGEGIQKPFQLMDEPSIKEKRIAARAADQAERRAVANFSHMESICDLAKHVHESLDESCERASLKDLGLFLSKKLSEMGRLLRSDDGTAYLLDDHNVPQEIDKKSDGFASAMMRMGISREERAYPVVCDYVREKARGDGKKVTLYNRAITTADEILLSHGAGGVLHLARDGSIQKTKTSTVLFSHSFPEWDYTAAPVDFRSLAIFARDFEVPPESPDYTSDVQHDLLQAWIAASLCGIRTPLLVLIGESGSGKSAILRALSIILTGSKRFVADVPEEKRDLLAVASNRPFYGIDNLDGRLDNSVENALCAAVSGLDSAQRELFTNRKVSSADMVARFAITTRNALFLSRRPDLVLRTIPIFVPPLLEEMQDDDDMLSPVTAHRDGLLARSVQRAIRVLNNSTKELTRFRKFERLSELHGWGVGLRQTQASLAPTPLITALERYLKNRKVLKGSATQIIAELRASGALGLQFIGEGRAAVSELREAMRILPRMGSSVEFTESTRHRNPWFVISAGTHQSNETETESEEI